MTRSVTVERHWLAEDPRVPNNPRMPLIVYRGAFDGSGGRAAEAVIQAHFAANDWSNGWVNGIYDFHHYHATAHEVLGIARGEADVQFGGPSGPVVRVAAGDAVLIPAGVGHCRKRASADLSVVGAYPGGGDYDLKRADRDDPKAAAPLIARVALPSMDPVLGAEGPATQPASRDDAKPAEPRAR
jgi:uncharacterized protein YjlB